MALKVRKTEMKGDTSRWMKRAEAKNDSKKIRRRVGKAEIKAELKDKESK